jgi:hypothetical protein
MDYECAVGPVEVRLTQESEEQEAMVATVAEGAAEEQGPLAEPAATVATASSLYRGGEVALEGRL